MNLDIAFVKHFVVKGKQHRLLELLTSGRRDAFIDSFRSPSIFDGSHVTEITGSARNSGALWETLKNMGLGGRVHVISSNNEWDQKKFQTSYIIDECSAMCIDTIGYSWKTKTAFYEWHHSGSTYYLS